MHLDASKTLILVLGRTTQIIVEWIYMGQTEICDIRIALRILTASNENILQNKQLQFCLVS